jgi:hypothetical protein
VSIRWRQIIPVCARIVIIHEPRTILGEINSEKVVLIGSSSYSDGGLLFYLV